MKKVILWGLAIVWGCYAILGVIKSYANYQLIDWIIILGMCAAPYVIYFFSKQMNRKRPHLKLSMGILILSLSAIFWIGSFIIFVSDGIINDKVPDITVFWVIIICIHIVCLIFMIRGKSKTPRAFNPPATPPPTHVSSAYNNSPNAAAPTSSFMSPTPTPPNCSVSPSSNFHSQSPSQSCKKMEHPVVIPPFAPEFKLHADLSGLIWFADGAMKNYTPVQDDPPISFLADIPFRTEINAEHSAIYTTLPVAIPADTQNVPRPPYYPRYDMLSPEQRWMYLQVLADPYGQHDVGYAFILYYGLERHLLLGDFDRAFDVIVKMQATYTNASFQSYSACALILSCIFRNRHDKLLWLIENMKDTESIPFEIVLIMLKGVGVPAAMLMRHASAFEFTNKRYIKSDFELFEKFLAAHLIEEFGQPTLPIPDTAKTIPMPIFANPSFLSTCINIPDIVHDARFSAQAYACLQTAHDQVKAWKAAERSHEKKISKD